MRRRKLLAGIGTATVPAMAGCGCGETWSSVGFVVEPTALSRTNDGWTVDATVDLSFSHGREGTGTKGVSLAAFDQAGSFVGTTRLGDLMWGDVPEGNRTEGECGTSGTLRRDATVEAGAFPQWVGIRYDETTRSYTESREIAVYRGQQGTDATADDYESVPVADLAPSWERPTTSPPVESVTFRPRELTCESISDPEINYSLAETALVEFEYGRTVPEPHYRPTLSGFEYGDVIRVDVGLGGRPQLRRTDCTGVPYEGRVRYDDSGTAPQEVELRHLDPQGEVVETTRRPITGSRSTRDDASQ